MIINNHHPDNISIWVDSIEYELSAHSSIELTNISPVIFCKILHKNSDWSDNISDTMINAISKLTAVIVDSDYIISEINEATILEITNEMVAYEHDDACIIYHGLIVKNAKVILKNCYSPNVKKFITARKFLLLDDANDFPVISPILAIVRYRKVKKMISQKNLWAIVSNKTASLKI